MTDVKVSPELINTLVKSLKFEFTRMCVTNTVCIATLPNGFTVGKGFSACVDPENYDKKKGEEYAKKHAIENAKKRLWELEGYLLKITGKTSDKFMA